MLITFTLLSGVYLIDLIIVARGLTYFLNSSAVGVRVWSKHKRYAA